MLLYVETCPVEVPCVKQRLLSSLYCAYRVQGL